MLPIAGNAEGGRPANGGQDSDALQAVAVLMDAINSMLQYFHCGQGKINTDPAMILVILLQSTFK